MSWWRVIAVAGAYAVFDLAGRVNCDANRGCPRSLEHKSGQLLSRNELDLLTPIFNF